MYCVYESMTQNNVYEYEKDPSMRTEGNTPHRAAPTRVDRRHGTARDVDARRRRGRRCARARVDAFVVVSFVVMVGTWCDACARAVATETNESNGFTCCTACGKILDERAAFSGEATFTKNARGASIPDGQYVGEHGVAPGVIRATRGGRVYGTQVDSHERTLYRGRLEIKQVADRLGVRPREDMVDAAHRLYKLAVQRNFTRGRRIGQVAGACLYVICRQESRPYMLIDFADVLQTNVYVLGGVFLQLCRLLRLEQHPLMQKPVDPSLFIHRFADKLNLGRRVHAVANTALRLVASMKRNWMQTGRRPNGICGAALWVAAQIHGFSPSKSDVVAVVHVGEATLKKRLSEFENTPSAALTAEEFDSQARLFEIEEESNRSLAALPSTGSMSVLSCVHKEDDNTPHFALGMCRACYVNYVRISGGSIGGADPPAFMRAQASRKSDESVLLLPQAGDVDVDADENLTSEFNSALEEGALSSLLASPSSKDQSRPLALVTTSKSTTTKMTMTDKEQSHRVTSAPRRELVGANFLQRAETSLRALVGSRWAELICLPFTGDLSKARISKRHMCELHPKYESFAENEGKYIAQIDESVLHFLISAECFDNSALDHLAKYSPHDVGSLESKAFDPSIVANDDQDEGAERGLVAKVEKEVVDTLSDVDDEEIDSYIHDADEVQLRRVVWSEMNKEYLETQASKKDVERAPGASKKKRKKTPSVPAETPAEAALQALSKKKGSSKINYEALENLFKVSDAQTTVPAATAPREHANEQAAGATETRRGSRRPDGLSSGAPNAKRVDLKKREPPVTGASSRLSGLGTKSHALRGKCN